MSLKQIADQLQQARKAKGLSQRKLADLVGIPQNHISKIESGQVDIRLSSLFALAEALDLIFTLQHAMAVNTKPVAQTKSRAKRLLEQHDALTARTAPTHTTDFHTRPLWLKLDDDGDRD